MSVVLYTRQEKIALGLLRGDGGAHGVDGGKWWRSRLVLKELRVSLCLPLGLPAQKQRCCAHGGVKLSCSMPKYDLWVYLFGLVWLFFLGFWSWKQDAGFVGSLL